jgi:hypothetical protein
MAKRLTALVIDNMKAGDTRREVPAGNNVFVTAQPCGRKGYCVRYRIAGRPRKQTLPSGLSLAQARKLAADAMFDVARGVDPAEARKTAQATARAASSIGRLPIAG